MRAISRGDVAGGGGHVDEEVRGCWAAVDEAEVVQFVGVGALAVDPEVEAAHGVGWAGGEGLCAEVLGLGGAALAGRQAGRLAMPVAAMSL
jgi:hypothetical protein